MNEFFHLTPALPQHACRPIIGLKAEAHQLYWNAALSMQASCAGYPPGPEQWRRSGTCATHPACLHSCDFASGFAAKANAGLCIDWCLYDLFDILYLRALENQLYAGNCAAPELLTIMSRSWSYLLACVLKTRYPGESAQPVWLLALWKVMCVAGVC